MTASENTEARDRQATWPRPILWQSSRRSNYLSVEQPRQRVRQPNALVPAEMRYWAEF
jgi:hypothetical protein